MTRTKVCGITNLDDAAAALAAGADYLGFIFYPPSPRSIDVPTTTTLVRELRTLPAFARPAPPQLVGVFVNEAAGTMAEVLLSCSLDLAQLSGEEPPALVMDAGAPLYGRAYKAIRPRSIGEAHAQTADYLIPAAVVGTNQPQLLLDSYHPSLRGGSGHVGDWETAAAIAAANPGIMLAGGLTPDNVADAVRAVRPFAVDVASGVEARPGKKDHDMLRGFVSAVRSADRLDQAHDERQS